VDEAWSGDPERQSNEAVIQTLHASWYNRQRSVMIRITFVIVTVHAVKSGKAAGVPWGLSVFLMLLRLRGHQNGGRVQAAADLFYLLALWGYSEVTTVERHENCWTNIVTHVVCSYFKI
jgi:hypothetical protein